METRAKNLNGVRVLAPSYFVEKKPPRILYQTRYLFFLQDVDIDFALSFKELL